MFITPMNRIGSISDLNAVSSSNGLSTQGSNNTKNISNNGNGTFQNIFSGLIDNVTQTDKQLTEGQYLLATGQIDDTHTVPIESTKAQLSVDLLVQLRNKALESYNELMRINL